MQLQAIVAICLSILHPLLCHDEQRSTWGDPILEYLKMDPNHVQYEVVPVLHSLHARSPNNSRPSQIHFKAFGKSYKLSLKPTEHLFNSNKHVPMWAITRNDSNPDGLDYEEIAEASTDVGDIYQDPTTMSSILLHYDNTGQLRVEGTVGSDLILQSLPVRVLKQVMDKTESLDDTDSLPELTSRERRSLMLTNHHVVIKRSIQSMDNQYMLMEPGHLSKRFGTNSPIRARSRNVVPRVIYPEILCIVDYDTYKWHGGNDAQIKRYFMVFWNAVDLRYKLLKNPEVRLNIAGMIISKDRDATPYLKISDGKVVNAATAIEAMGEYLYRQKKLPVYDITITMTKLDLCAARPGEDVCRKSVAGIANVECACFVSDLLKTIASVGIVEDTGGFSGIIPAAHELGHLLGAVHDGSPPDPDIAGPGAAQCSWEDGYIMSYVRKNENAFKWSPCSVEQFRFFFKSDTAAKCLYNVPRNNEKLPEVLPGTLLSLDQQCQKDFGTNACSSDSTLCLRLRCVHPSIPGYCLRFRPPAEGSPCGNGQHCISGRCIAKH